MGEVKIVAFISSLWGSQNYCFIDMLKYWLSQVLAVGAEAEGLEAGKKVGILEF